MQGRAGFMRLAGALLALALAAVCPCAFAQSPELFQLLNDINGELKVLSPSVTRGPVCLPEMIQYAKEGLQSQLASTALNKVVVEPLEKGAKLGVGALGGGILVTSYSVMKCALTATDAKSFAQCIAGEAVGYGLGQGLEAAHVNDLAGSVAGTVWDQAWGDATDAWNSYGQTNEDLDWQTDGDCKISVNVRWAKRRQPGAEGGLIFISVRAENCKCPTASSLKSGSLRVTIPVRYAPAGNNQPGFRAGIMRDLRIEATCCGATYNDPRVYLYNNAGQLTGIVQPQGPGTTPEPPKPPTTGPPPTTTGPPPPPPPPPPPVRPPKPPVEKPVPVWPPAPGDMAKVCPECESYAETIRQLRALLARIDGQLGDLNNQLLKAREAARNAENDIRRARNELRAQEGTGGEAFDPDTGLVTQAYTQADGSVRVRTFDKATGQTVEEHTRPRGDLTAARQRLADAEKKLDQARADEARVQGSIEQARGERARAEASLHTQEALYEECIERCRRKVVLGETGTFNALVAPHEFRGGIATNPGDGFTPAPDAPLVTGVRPLSVAPSTIGQICPQCAQAANELARAERSLETLERTPKVPGNIVQNAIEQVGRLRSQLRDCIERQCRDFLACMVEVERVSPIRGNNPFDPIDPLRSSESSSSSSSPSCGANGFNGSPSAYSCGGTCGILSFNLTNGGPSSTTLNPFGTNGATAFNVCGITATSASNNLTILGLPGHQCTLLALPGHSLSLVCRNNGGAGPGQCNSTCN